MMPPAIIAFWCEFRIAPNVGGKWHGEAQRNEGPIDRIVGRMEEAYLRTVAELQRAGRNAPHVTQEWVLEVASMDRWRCGGG